MITKNMFIMCNEEIMTDSFNLLQLQSKIINIL